MKETLTKRQREIIGTYCDSVGTIDISKTYSGRGMYGRACFGFNVDAGTTPTSIVAGIIKEAFDIYVHGCDDDCDAQHIYDFIELFTTHEMKQDNLGRGMIYYFPTLQWGDVEPEDMRSEEDSPEE